MNRAASHLADREELRGAVQSERLLQADGAGTGSSTWEKAGWLWRGHPPLRDAGVRQAYDLTVLTRRFLIPWFKIPFLGEAETK